MRTYTQVFLFLFLLQFCITAVAQSVMLREQAPPSDIASSAPPQKGTSFSVSSSPTGPKEARRDPPPFQFGPLEIRPHMEYRLSYGDGIQVKPGSPLKTVIHELSPGVFVNVGDRITIDYSGTQTYYSRKQFRDSFDHDLRLEGFNTLNNWSLQLSQDYTSSSAPLVETARQTEQENANTVFSAACPIGRSFSVALSATQSLRFAKAVGDSFEWSTMDWLNYQAVRYLGLGLGLGTGYVDIISAPNMKYDRFLGKININLSKKITISLDGGIELRRTNNSSSTETSNPIYNGTLIYSLFERTTLSAKGGRTVGVSLFQNQISDSRNWMLSINQRLLGKITLTGAYGESKSIFQPIGIQSASARTDDRQMINLGLRTVFLTRGTASISYSKNKNSTNQAGYGYTSNQFVFDLSYKY